MCPLSCSTFWEFNVLVLPPIISLFGESLTRVGVFFPFNRCSLECCTNSSLFMCGSKGRRLVICLSYHTNILFITNSLSFCTTYSSCFATSYIGLPFMVSIWSYHWQFRYPFTPVPLYKWTYSNPWHTSRYSWNYCFGEWSTCSKGCLPPFPLPHLTMSGYSYY
jgi:hypothetical protein